MEYLTCDMCGQGTRFYTKISGGVYCKHCGHKIIFDEFNIVKERVKKINKIKIRMKNG